VPSEYPTIQAAADTTAPGDVVLVAAGSFRGVDVTRSGTAGNPITYRGLGPSVIDQGSVTNDDGVRLQNVSYVIVEGFSIQAATMTGRCIAARGATPTAPMTGNTIRQVSCRNAAHEGFYLSEYGNGLVEGCTITGSGRDGAVRGHGIYLANAGSDGTTLRGNTISGTVPAESAGIHLNGDLSVGGDGLIQDVVIEGNIITGNNHNGINADGVQRSVIRNNLITNNARSGIRVYAIDAAAGPSGLKIVSNTIIGNANWALKLTEDLGGHVVFDNILSSTTGSLCVGSAVASDHNVLLGLLSTDEEASTINFAAWRSVTSQDAASISTAPSLFVSGTDFHLSATSAARNAGVLTFSSVTAPPTDLEGASRPKGAAIDIGAYEYNE
jgi:hypothetical protein